MNRHSSAFLRHMAPFLALILAFCPGAANAYTSNGSDGVLHPVVSTVLDPSQSIFNYSDIFIPAGVTVTYTFGGPSQVQPIEFLAAGNIEVAGTLVLNAGINDLWIETPGSFKTLGSGTMHISANSIWLFADPLGSSGGTGAGIVVGGGVTISSWSGREPRLTGGGTVALVPEPETYAMMMAGLGIMGAVARRKKLHA